MPANVDTMAYRGETPWHKQGTEVAGAVNTRQMQAAAGLEWEVEKRPVKVPIINRNTGKARFETYEPVKATVRVDIETILGIVGEDYEVIQNRDAFKITDPLVEDGGLQYETAGALGDGEVVWVMLSDPDPFTIDGDTIAKYFLVRTSHDRSCALEVMITPVRVVCQNTLHMALSGSEAANRFKVFHYDGANSRIEAAARVLETANEYFDDMEMLFSHFLEYPMSVGEFERFATGLMPENDEGELSSHAQRDVEVMVDIFEGNGTGFTNRIVETKYGAVQAITEFADHEKTVRATGDTTEEEARLKSVWDGSAARFKQKAFNRLREWGDTPDPILN